MSSEGLYKLNEIALINPKRKVLKGNEVPFIEMAALPLSSRDIQKKDVEIRVAKNSGSHFKNGDTLLARITPCLENGKGAQVNCFSDGEIGEGSTEFIVLCGISSEDNDFVYYLTRTDEFRAYAISRMEGTSGRQRVSWQSIAAYEFYLPDLHFRRSAAALLTKIDDRITLLRETNATLEAIAQAIFKSWFVDFDPVHANAHTRAQQSGNSHPQAVQQNPAPHTAEAIAQNLGLDAATAALFPDHFQDSDLGPIPVGWRVGMLSDATVQKKGSINPLSDPSILFEHYSLPAFDNGQYPVFELGEEIKSNKTQLPYEAVLLSKLNPHIPRVWLPVKHGENAVCSTEFLAYSPRGSFGKEWLYCLFSSEEFQQQLCQLVTGTSNSHQRVKPDHVLEKKIVLAPNDVLETFRKIASPIFEKVYENRQQAQTLTQLRDTLLPRLISGQLRLPDAEAQVEAAVGGA